MPSSISSARHYSEIIYARSITGCATWQFTQALQASPKLRPDESLLRSRLPDNLAPDS